nr:histidinol-phosphate transaminase [uncultured Mediterraneibacter sp.]
MVYGHGGDIYTYEDMMDFSVNINPLGPSERVVDAAKRGVEQMAAYPDSRCRKLREKLSKRQGVPEEAYIFGNGAADLIYTLVLAEKPRRALLPVPAFSEYEQALRTSDCHIRYYYTEQKNFFCVSESFLSEITEEVDIVFLCSPSNPSGHKIGKSLLLEIAGQCEKFGVRMVVDECFIEFLTDQEEHFMPGMLKRYRQLFLVRAFTKAHAMPGLRLGYGITSDYELIEKMESSRQPWSVSIPAQTAGLAALDDRERIGRMRKLVAKERERIENQLRNMEIEFIPSDANFILLYSDINLFDELKNYNILIRDCSNYRGLGKGWYRIAVRTEKENDCLIKAIKEIVSRNFSDRNREDVR